jgi:hypothetical protein
VIKEYAGLLSDERETDGFAGIDCSVIFQKIDLRCMEIHRVRIFVLSRVVQGEIDGIPFRHPYDRTGNLPVKRPGGIPLAVTLDDHVRLHRRHFHIVNLGLNGQCHGGHHPECYSEHRYRLTTAMSVIVLPCLILHSCLL